MSFSPKENINWENIRESIPVFPNKETTHKQLVEWVEMYAVKLGELMKNFFDEKRKTALKTEAIQRLFSNEFSVEELEKINNFIARKI